MNKLKYLAQSAVNGVEPIGPLSSDDVGAILDRLTTWLFTAFMICAILAIIFAAFKYLTAGENAENVRSANRAVIYAVVAIAAALLSGSISQLIFSLLQG